MFQDIRLGDLVIVGVDPGVSHMGMCAMYVTPDLSTIKHITAKTTHGDHAELETYLTTNIDERYTKIIYHEHNLSNWISYHDPSYVVYEKPFIQGSRPQAYGALVESTMCIKRAVYGTSRYIYVYEYTPLNIKRSIGVKNFHSKDYVLEAIQNIPELYELLKNKMSLLDDHALDSIAVAYTHLNNLRNNLV